MSGGERFLLFTLLWGLVTGDIAVPYLKMDNGAYFNEMPSTVIYEGNIPLHFVMKLPDLQRIPQRKTTCGTKSVFLCNLLNISQTLEEIIWEQTFENPYLAQIPSRSGRGLFNFVGEIEKYLFGIATQTDVSELHISVNEMEARENEFVKGFAHIDKDLAVVIKNFTAYNGKFKKAIEQDLNINRQNILNVANNAFSGEEALGEISSIILTNQYRLELSQKLKDAASDCRNKLVPRTLISTDVLGKKITNVDGKLESRGYVAAASVSKLMKLPITDCVFSPNDVRVTIHLPIVRKNKQYKLYEVIKVPYQWNSDQCSLMDPTQFIAVGSDGSVVPITTHMERYCAPLSRGYCYIPKNVRDPSLFAMCAEKLFTGNFTDIKQSCLFQCMKTESVRVSEINQGVLAITNAKVIQVFCKSDESVRRYLLKPIGAVLLALGCQCNAEINDDGHVLTGPFPCSNSSDSSQEEIVTIIPPQMRSLTFNTSGDLVVPHSHLPEVIDKYWINTLPTLRLTPPSPFKMAPFDITRWKEGTTDNLIVIYIWLAVLTAGLGSLVYAAVCGSVMRVFSPIR